MNLLSQRRYLTCCCCIVGVEFCLKRRLGQIWEQKFTLRILFAGSKYRNRKRGFSDDDRVTGGLLLIRSLSPEGLSFTMLVKNPRMRRYIRQLKSERRKKVRSLLDIALQEIYWQRMLITLGSPGMVVVQQNRNRSGPWRPCERSPYFGT